jgi:hypothetical protein
MNRVASLLACVLGFFLHGCGQDPSVAQGPGSETSGLTAVVLRSDGAPAPGVAVRAVALEGWFDSLQVQASPVLGSAVSDDSGRVFFPGLHGARLALVGESGNLVGRTTGTWSAPERAVVRLGEGATVRIRLPAGARSVHLAGFERALLQGRDSVWTATGVATGLHRVLVRTDSGYSLAGTVLVRAPGLVDTTLQPDLSSTHLDDFESPLGINRYGDILGAGWWYVTSDPDSQGITPRDPGLARQAGPWGTHLAFVYHPDTTLSQRWSSFGMNFGGGEGIVFSDLRSLVAVRMRVKGQGDFHVQIHVLRANGTYGYFQAPIAVSPEWAWVEIPVASFLPRDSSVTWTRDAAKAQGISILATTPGELSIDDIWLDGVSPWILYPRLRQP